MAMNVKCLLAVMLFVPVASLSSTSIAWADELALSANTPEVSISTRPAGRNFMRLPALKYDFAVDASCGDGLSPESLSLSIADTRVTNSLNNDTGPRVELSVNVPASQIGPIAVDQFCSTDSTDSGEDGHATLRVPAVLSAQAALMCFSESGNEMTYASESLDVLLRCDTEDESETHSIRR